MIHADGVLTIDVAAIVANWRLVRGRLAAGCAAAAVVKADAYGLGVAQVAPALAAAGCRDFFVATLDEGLALRPLLPAAARVLVLGGPPPGAEDAFAAHDLVPVVNSLEQLARLRGRVRRLALHLDTGMNRLGLEPAEVERLADDPAALAGVEPALVMSHLACADEPDHPMNQAQRAALVALAGRLPPAPLSLAASSGIFLDPAVHFQLVRPGACLYGLAPRPDQPNPLAQVITLQGKILQVRDIDRPMTVGYGATGRVAAGARLATVGIGYADGWLRSLSNRGIGVLGGIAVPMVGRVSMDLMTFDVSAAPPALARPGQYIELIGPLRTVDQVAADAGTIGYEILTALGRRYHRRHVGQDRS